MPGIVIDAGNTAVNKAEESLPLSNIYFSWVKEIKNM